MDATNYRLLSRKLKTKFGKIKTNCTTDRKSPDTDCITPTKCVYSYCTSVCNGDDFIR